MNLLVWTIVGCITGAVCGIIMSKHAAEFDELLLNVVTGAIGALLGGTLLAPIFGTGDIDTHHYSNAKLLVAIVSALALLAIVNALGQLNKRH